VEAKKIGLAVAFLSVAAIASTGAESGNPAVVAVGEDSGIDASSLVALRRLVTSNLSARRVTVIEDPRLSQVRPIDQETLRIAQELGAQRVFVLQPSRLGSKIILSLQERDPKGAVVYEASLTAQSLEESDRVIPRLVTAVLSRTDAATTAEISTVTAQEAAPYVKKPGEKFWALGLPLGLSGGGVKSAFGLSLGWEYETEHLGVGFQLLGAGSPNFGALLAGIHGVWLPLSGEWSPYVSPGIGFMHLWKDDVDGGGAGFTAEVGVEFFRLHGFRLMVGAQALLPAYELNKSNAQTWVPLFLLHVRIAF